MYLLPSPAYPSATLDMFRQLNRLLTASDDGPFGAFSSGELMTNVHEDDKAFHVEMEIPGVRPEEVDVSLTGTELTIKIRHEECCCKKDSKAGNKDKERYLRHERHRENLVRTIELPLESPPKDVKAEIKDGLLRVTLCKPAPAKVRKIEVAG